jgi:hypothetical protein
MLRPPSGDWDTNKTRMILILVIGKNRANGTKGQGQASPSGLPPRGGTDTPVPPNPSATFTERCIAFTDDATHGDAELEGDWEWFG